MFISFPSGLYFRYRDVNSRVTRWNLVACNGVIHLLTHYLFEPPSATARDPPVNTPTSLNAQNPVKMTGGGGRLGAARFGGLAGAAFLSLCLVWGRTEAVGTLL